MLRTKHSPAGRHAILAASIACFCVAAFAEDAPDPTPLYNNPRSVDSQIRDNERELRFYRACRRLDPEFLSRSLSESQRRAEKRLLASAFNRDEA